MSLRDAIRVFAGAPAVEIGISEVQIERADNDRQQRSLVVYHAIANGCGSDTPGKAITPMLGPARDFAGKKRPVTIEGCL